MTPAERAWFFNRLDEIEAAVTELTSSILARDAEASE